MPRPDHRDRDWFSHSPGDFRALPLKLGGWVVGSVLMVAVVSAGSIAISGSPSWWSGWASAAGVSLITAVISILPLLLGVQGGIQTTIAGFFAAMFLRMVLMLGGCAAAIWIWHSPAEPTLFLAGPFYLAQLIAECAVLARAFWSDSRHASV